MIKNQNPQKDKNFRGVKFSWKQMPSYFRRQTSCVHGSEHWANAEAGAANPDTLADFVISSSTPLYHRISQ